MRIVALALLSVFVITLAGCEEKKKDEKKAAVTKTEPAKTQPAAKTPEATAAPEPVRPVEPAAAPVAPVVYAPLGIPECDALYEKVAKCLNSPQFPAASRDVQKGPMDNMVNVWKQGVADAKTPEQKAAIAKGCSQVMETEKGMIGGMCPGVW